MALLIAFWFLCAMLGYYCGTQLQNIKLPTVKVEVAPGK